MRATLDTSQWVKFFDAVGPKNFRKGEVRAINRTAANANTAMVRVVSADMGLKQAAVRKNISIMKASAVKPIARLYALTARIPLIQFNARSAKRGGVRAKLPTGAGTYPNAFIATMRSGHTGVFERNTTTRSRAGKPRGSPQLGIHQLFGPSVAQSFQKNGSVAQVRATEMLPTNMAAEMKYLVAQAQQ